MSGCRSLTQTAPSSGKKPMAGAAKIRQMRSVTSDGGFIIAGATDSYGVGADDVWLLKLDAAGAVQWEKTYGGSSTKICDSADQRRRLCRGGIYAILRSR